MFLCYIDFGNVQTERVCDSQIFCCLILFGRFRFDSTWLLVWLLLFTAFIPTIWKVFIVLLCELSTEYRSILISYRKYHNAVIVIIFYPFEWVLIGPVIWQLRVVKLMKLYYYFYMYWYFIECYLILLWYTMINKL